MAGVGSSFAFQVMFLFFWPIDCIFLRVFDALVIFLLRKIIFPRVLKHTQVWLLCSFRMGFQ